MSAEQNNVEHVNFADTSGPSMGGIQPQKIAQTLQEAGVDVNSALEKGQDVVKALGMKKTMTGVGVGLILLSMIVPDNNK